jgi:hypothetical protein
MHPEDAGVAYAGRITMTAPYKPILCLDWDGVIHSYTSPWVNATTIPDPVVPGFFEWAASAAQHFRLVIYSSRSKEPGAIDAMRTWLECQYILVHGLDREGVVDMLSWFEFAHEKPPAFLTIDDRVAPCFRGDWSDPAFDPETLRAFKTWNRP